MKLEVGIYVRTKKGSIGKILGIDLIEGNSIELNNIEGIYFDNVIDDISNELYWGVLSQVFKDSKLSNNIIDLIEVGDYVNGSEVTSIEENGWLGFGDNDWYIPNSDGIKSIVTKEQFESMEYRVEN